MSEKRLLARERVPFRRRDRIERGGDFQGGYRPLPAAFLPAGYVVRSRFVDAVGRAMTRITKAAERGGRIRREAMWQAAKSIIAECVIDCDCGQGEAGIGANRSVLF